MKGRGQVFAAALLLVLGTQSVMAQGEVCLPKEATLDPSDFRGFFEGPLGGGKNVATGVVGMTGWVMAVSGVDTVQIVVDDVIAMNAHYGQLRPGISDIFTGFPDGDQIGFGAHLDTTRFTNGPHQVNALVTANDGRQALLIPRTIVITNSTHLLQPFGDLESPQEDATLVGWCTVGHPDRFYTAFVGWALDTGVEIGHRGLGWVELLVDGVIMKNTRRDCNLVVEAGGLTDCYGLTRHETTGFFPTLADTPHSGFRFTLDIGKLITDGGLTRGHHDIVIRAGDISGQQANIDEFPVVFSCVEDFINFDSIGDIEIGDGPKLVGGVVNVHGWALDFEGVITVRVLIDGVFHGLAAYGFSRPGVTQLYPSFPNSNAPAWMLQLDTTALTNGEHTLGVEVQDTIGTRTFIGERRFTVFNPVD